MTTSSSYRARQTAHTSQSSNGRMSVLTASFPYGSRSHGGKILSAFCRRRQPGVCGSSWSFQTQAALHIAVISGTSRTSGPPRPVLGPRVVNFISGYLEEQGHTVHTIDPTSFPLLEKPHFSYAKSRLPSFLEEAHSILQHADAYVCVTPEYNHAPSPALLNVLNHFGSSVFSFKPSAIVSYSAGQWGGTRAASALRPILGELGCLPVSAMIHIPKAQDVVEEDGEPKDDAERWKEYCNRCFSQLGWWGEAAKGHRSKVDPLSKSPAFQNSPSQRDAPSL